MPRKDIISYIDNIAAFVFSISLFIFPLLFLTNTTEAFVLPKQLLIIASASLLLLLFGVKLLSQQKVVLNVNPVNIPVLLFGVAVFASAILSRNRFDSLMQAVPMVFVLFFFFALVNFIKTRKSFYLALYSLLLGGAFSALVTIAYYFKLYFLPIPNIQNQFFNTFGSIMQELIYLIPLLIFTLFYVGKKLGFPKVRFSPDIRSDLGFFVETLTGIAVLIGFLLILFQIIFLPNKPIILPYIYGFQTAFASISQDTQRFILSLLFGSGYGTFLIDFTRFKLPSFNLEQNIWNLNFAFSSSYVLELVSTTGILGGLTFVLLIVGMIKSRVKGNGLFAALFTTFVLSFILPFAFSSIALLFIILGLYIVFLNVSEDKRVYDIVLATVSARGGISFEANPEDGSRIRNENPILPAVVFVLILLIIGTVGFFTYKFILADLAFAESLRQANLNNGQKTYTLQAQSINTFPYRSDYHRIFSQVNMALANSLSQSIQPNSSPSAQVQQSIISLLQQSISSARNAVILSPQTAINWQNLSQIYRNLINVGQNAEQFSIASLKQAIALDPYNPQLYIQLGGIYYQLKQYDPAQNQFQVAIDLKRDFANGYYNLGHALEEKGDLQNALAAYQIVKQLSVNNKENLALIETEIKALEAKIGAQKETAKKVEPETEQTPLSISSPSAQLPPQKPPIKISPPPEGEPEATKSAE